MFHFIRYHHHLAQHTPFFRRFFYATWVYVFVCLLAAGVAIQANLKVDWQHKYNSLSVAEDFMYGIGTALSPPLIALLILIVLVDLTFKHTLTAKVALVFIVLLCIENSLMAALQPLGARLQFGVFYPALHVVVIVFPLVIAWMAADIFITRLKTVISD